VGNAYNPPNTSTGFSRVLTNDNTTQLVQNNTLTTKTTADTTISPASATAYRVTATFTGSGGHNAFVQVRLVTISGANTTTFATTKTTNNNADVSSQVIFYLHATNSATQTTALCTVLAGGEAIDSTNTVSPTTGATITTLAGGTTWSQQGTLRLQFCGSVSPCDINCQHVIVEEITA